MRHDRPCRRGAQPAVAQQIGVDRGSVNARLRRGAVGAAPLRLFPIGDRRVGRAVARSGHRVDRAFARSDHRADRVFARFGRHVDRVASPCGSCRLRRRDGLAGRAACLSGLRVGRAACRSGLRADRAGSRCDRPGDPIGAPRRRAEAGIRRSRSGARRCRESRFRQPGLLGRSRAPGGRGWRCRTSA